MPAAMASDEILLSSPVEDAVREYRDGIQELDDLQRRGLRNTPAYKKLKHKLFVLWSGELQAQNQASPKHLPDGISVSSAQLSHVGVQLNQNSEGNLRMTRDDLGAQSNQPVNATAHEFSSAKDIKERDENKQQCVQANERDDDDEEEVINMGEQAAPYQWLRDIMNGIGSGLTTLLNPQDNKKPSALEPLPQPHAAGNS